MEQTGATAGGESRNSSGLLGTIAESLGIGHGTAETNPEDTEGMTDTDEDGVPDIADNCESVENEDQEDCDSDGVGDACDTCGDGTCYIGQTCSCDCDFEHCDGVDNDDDGVIDEGCPCNFNGSSQGVCGTAEINEDGECEVDDAVTDTELCDNNKDNDCDGQVPSEDDDCTSECSADVFALSAEDEPITLNEGFHTDVASSDVLFHKIQNLPDGCSVWFYENENPPKKRFGDPDAEWNVDPGTTGTYAGDDCVGAGEENCQWNRHNDNIIDASGSAPAAAVFVAPVRDEGICVSRQVVGPTDPDEIEIDADLYISEAGDYSAEIVHDSSTHPSVYFPCYDYYAASPSCSVLADWERYEEGDTASWTYDSGDATDTQDPRTFSTFTDQDGDGVAFTVELRRGDEDHVVREIEFPSEEMPGPTEEVCIRP